MFPCTSLDRLLPLAFEEDVNTGDITSLATIPDSSVSIAHLTTKSDGCIAGLPVISRIFEFKTYSGVYCGLVEEGQWVKAGTNIFKIETGTRNILECERILLNFLQRLCGIATQSHIFQKAVSHTKIKILDSRKTLPGFRELDKYAVRTGGASNHRMGLYDAVLIKDNHIQACGKVRDAVDIIHKAYGDKYIIETEVETNHELETLAGSKVNWIMLDNMAKKDMASAVAFIRREIPNAKIELSGNMSLAKITEVADLDVDYISVGALTHSVEAMDISLNFIETSHK
ncbi:MAG: carboxylating nicotinate-nucleotide diphosphorylase [Fibrobacteria bacterium]|nr:carboxylating nicotinate-nucleotide diphosphorylase [Fibrobacteria bacterium]